jgi:hypothetical protein
MNHERRYPDGRKDRTQVDLVFGIDPRKDVPGATAMPLPCREGLDGGRVVCPLGPEVREPVPSELGRSPTVLDL